MPMSKAERTARIDILDRMANMLDTRFKVPGIGIPVGWDSILGLIPGVGDAVTIGPGAWTIYEASRMGARRRVLARMAINTGVDAVVGSIPLLGDLFDVAFKSHRRNVDLLKQEVARLDKFDIEENSTWQSANDPKAARETPTRSSERVERSRKADAKGDGFRDTSEARTN